MTQPHQHRAQVIVLDDYRRARRDDNDPRPPSYPQAAYPPAPPEIVPAIAASASAGRLTQAGAR